MQRGKLKTGGKKSIANHPLATQFFYSAWASLGGKMPAALKGQSREFTILGGGNKLHLKGKSGRYQLQLKRQSRETTILGGNKSSAIKGTVT